MGRISKFFGRSSKLPVTSQPNECDTAPCLTFGVSAADLAEPYDFYSNTDCPIARSLKRLFPEFGIAVALSFFYIGGTAYQIVDLRVNDPLIKHKAKPFTVTAVRT